MARFIFDMVRVCRGTRLFERVDFVKVHAGILLDRVKHGNSGKRLAEVDFHAVIGNHGCAEHFLRDVAIKVFGQIHHAVIIGISLIEFHQRKFRAVAGVKTLVAEHAADFIDALETADNQTFEVKFQRNTQFEIFVKRIEMGHERTRRRTAGIGYEHRGFNLHKALAVQIGANGTNDFGTLDKGIARILVHNQIDIALTIAHIGISKAVEFFRKHLQAFGQQRNFGGVNGDFTGFGFENFTFDADNIADIEFLKRFIRFFTDAVARNIRLDIAF